MFQVPIYRPFPKKIKEKETKTVVQRRLMMPRPSFGLIDKVVTRGFDKQSQWKPRPRDVTSPHGSGNPALSLDSRFAAFQNLFSGRR